VKLGEAGPSTVEIFMVAEKRDVLGAPSRVFGDIVSPPTEQSVKAAPAAQDVVSIAARHYVVAETAVQPVVPLAPKMKSLPDEPVPWSLWSIAATTVTRFEPGLGSSIVATQGPSLVAIAKR
jgi:hypothetical protein